MVTPRIKLHHMNSGGHDSVYDNIQFKVSGWHSLLLILSCDLISLFCNHQPGSDWQDRFTLCSRVTPEPEHCDTTKFCSHTNTEPLRVQASTSHICAPCDSTAFQVALISQHTHTPSPSSPHPSCDLSRRARKTAIASDMCPFCSCLFSRKWVT